MKSQKSRSTSSRAEPWIALALCASVLAAGVAAQFVKDRPTYASGLGPHWLPIVATGLAAAGILLYMRGRLHLLREVLLWGGLLSMVWVANGLPLDLLRLTPLMPPGVDWPGLVTRALALASVVELARLVFARSAPHLSGRRINWYGYAAFVLALPYPVLRTCWVLGGTLGLVRPGAAGEGFAPWLACIPWLMAATLSLLLVLTPRWMPRRLLLGSGWFATVVVAMIGPAAFWSLITGAIGGNLLGIDGIAEWVPWLFYCSWFLWALAAAAATRTYQLGSLTSPVSLPVLPRASFEPRVH